VVSSCRCWSLGLSWLSCASEVQPTVAQRRRTYHLMCSSSGHGGCEGGHRAFLFHHERAHNSKYYFWFPLECVVGWVAEESLPLYICLQFKKISMSVSSTFLSQNTHVQRAQETSRWCKCRETGQECGDRVGVCEDASKQGEESAPRRTTMQENNDGEV